MDKSTVPTTSSKPRKPRPNFPLWPHPNGLWARKINGKCWYFGSWRDDTKGDTALERYKAEIDDIKAGRDPRAAKKEGYTLGMLCNDYLNKKRVDAQTGKITARQVAELHDVCKRLLDCFGAGTLAEDIGPSEFGRLEMGFPATWKLRRRKREITNIRGVFLYAVRQEKIMRARFGDFKAPSLQDIRGEKLAIEMRHGNREFTPEQLRDIIDAAPVQLKAMVLLGCNCGFGNDDCAKLTSDYIDLNRGVHTFPRPKTSVERRALLWPETVLAIREALEQRPRPKNLEHEKLVFVRRDGLPWVRVDEMRSKNGDAGFRRHDSIAKQFRKTLKQLGIHRRNLSFYSLRHCCETHGGTDQIALDRVMGHVSAGMGTNYRESISDERLKAVADSLRKWVFGEMALTPEQAVIGKIG